MPTLIEAALIALILTNLSLLGSSRLQAAIRTVASQGLVLGLLAFLAYWGTASLQILGLAAATVLVKTWVLPWLLRRALREADIRSESRPFVSHGGALVYGALALALAFYLAARLPFPAAAQSPLSLPVALFMLLVGLFLIVSRRKALSQVLGYLVMENGIYVFGIGLAIEVPFSVEVGILLDLVVAVFLMGITLFHINRSFDDVDTTRMSTLRD